MKGISTVIATLLMLVITVALAITAYGYISGLFATQTEGLVELVDASCNTGSGQYFAVVRNLDQLTNVTTGEILINLDDVPVPASNMTWSDPQIAANGGTSIATINGAGPTAGEVNRIKVIGPTGRPQTLTVSC